MASTNKPTIRIHDLETNQIIDREMTADEIAQMEQDNLLLKEKMAEQQAKLQAKAAILAKLGLTAEEATALLQ